MLFESTYIYMYRYRYRYMYIYIYMYIYRYRYIYMCRCVQLRMMGALALLFMSASDAALMLDALLNRSLIQTGIHSGNHS